MNGAVTDFIATPRHSTNLTYQYDFVCALPICNFDSQIQLLLDSSMLENIDIINSGKTPRPFICGGSSNVIYPRLFEIHSQVLQTLSNEIEFLDFFTIAIR